MSQPSLFDIATKLNNNRAGFSASGALAAGKTVATVAGNIRDTAATARENTQQWTAGGSLIRFTQSSRVEPLVIVEAELANLDITTDILKMLHTRFTAYYLLGVSMLTTVGKVRVVETLNQLNPDRRAYGIGIESFESHEGELKAVYEKSLESNYWRSSVGDYQWRLPTRANVPALEDRLTTYSYESQQPPTDLASDALAYDTDREATAQGKYQAAAAQAEADAMARDNEAGYRNQQQHAKNKADQALKDANTAVGQANDRAKAGDPKRPGQKINFDLKSMDAVQTAAALSIGRLIEVKLESEGVTASAVVQIRLMVSLLRSSLISEFFIGDNKMDKKLRERFYQWKAGAISFWGDLVFCQDLIKKRRRKLLNDKSGVVTEIHKRESNADLTSATTAKASLASRSNLFVVSKASVGEIYRKSGVDIENFGSRQKLFDAGLVMMMVVVDTDRDMVYIYEDTVRIPTTLAMRDVAVSAGKGDNGASVMELLKAMQTKPSGF